jgi:hypothetical protein
MLQERRLATSTSAFGIFSVRGRNRVARPPTRITTGRDMEFGAEAVQQAVGHWQILADALLTPQFWITILVPSKTDFRQARMALTRGGFCNDSSPRRDRQD